MGAFRSCRLLIVSPPSRRFSGPAGQACQPPKFVCARKGIPSSYEKEGSKHASPRLRFACAHRGFACAHRGFACAHRGFACAHRGFACAHRGFACVHRGFACAHRGFACAHRGFACAHRGFACAHRGFACVRGGFACVDGGFNNPSRPGLVEHRQEWSVPHRSARIRYRHSRCGTDILVCAGDLASRDTYTSRQKIGLDCAAEPPHIAAFVELLAALRNGSRRS
jgi:hypothetical protein